MNLIFLDIDVVLNMYGVSCRTFMKPYGQHIEPHLVQRLNYICENVQELAIVISSSWRNDMEDLKVQLEQQGFKYWNLVIDKTPKCYREHEDYSKPAKLINEFRGEQIIQWLNDSNFKGKYLVIDDEITDICGDYCNVIPTKNVLQTDGDEGLLHKDVIKIIEFFKEQR